MSTIKEVARRARVSVGTVSHVLTGATSVSPKRRNRILAAIRELDYHPNDVARSLKLSRSHMLGMVVSDITNPFFSLLVRGAEDAAVKQNYLLLTFNTDERVEREMQVLSVLQKRRVDGVLLVVAPSQGKFSHVTQLISCGTPVVCLDRVPRGVRVDSVTIDNASATRGCIEHLVDKGHRRIAIITGSLLLQTARDRLQGYKDALSLRRIPIDPQLICEGDFRIESGFQLVQKILSRIERPTAIFVSNGLMSIGALKAILRSGLRCPEDIALASFDDMFLSDVLQPPLTAVVQPAYDMGYRGAEMLMARIESLKNASSKATPRRTARVQLVTELKIRESTDFQVPCSNAHSTRGDQP